MDKVMFRTRRCNSKKILLRLRNKTKEKIIYKNVETKIIRK